MERRRRRGGKAGRSGRWCRRGRRLRLRVGGVKSFLGGEVGGGLERVVCVYGWDCESFLD